MGMAREVCVAEVRATLESLQQAHHPTPLNSRYTECLRDPSSRTFMDATGRDINTKAPPGALPRICRVSKI